MAEDNTYSMEEVENLKKAIPGETFTGYSPQEVEGIKAQQSANASNRVIRSTYEGVPDSALNWFQKLERGSQNVGLVKPGYEMFSPQGIEAKKNILIGVPALGKEKLEAMAHRIKKLMGGAEGEAGAETAAAVVP